MLAPIPSNEVERLAALREYQILDTPAEEVFDRVTRQAARLCGTPISLVTFIDANRQWYKSRVGIDHTETPRDVSFCAYAILDDDLLVVPDARSDPRFQDNPLVTGPPGIRFYAGAPLATPAGQRLGTLCVIDREPRELSANQCEVLTILSRCLVAELEYRRTRCQKSPLYEAVEDLQVSEAKLANALDAAGVGMWDWDLGTNQVRWQGHTSRLLGYPPGQTDGSYELWRRTVHPDDLARLESEISGQIRDGKPSVVEYRVIWPDGSVHWLESRGQTLPSGECPPTRMLGTLVETTARNQAETELRASEARLALALEAAQMGFWDWDLRTQQVIWSGHHARLFGYPADLREVTYEMWRTRVHPEDLDQVEQTVQEAIRYGSYFRNEYRIVWPDGTVRWVRSRGRTVAKEGKQPERMLGAVVDVTDSKSMEEALRQSRDDLERRVEERTAALRESETFLQLALAASGIGLWSWDLATNVFAFSSDYWTPLGYGSREVSSDYAAWESLIHPEDLARVRATLERYLRQPWPDFQVEFRMCHKDGTYRWIHCRAELIRDSAGQPMRLTGCQLDVTEARRTETRLRELESNLAHAYRLSSMGEMAAGLAHEVSQPLTTANHYCGAALHLLKSGQGDTTTALHCLERLSENILFAGEVIRRLRNFVTRRPPRFFAVDLHSLLHEVSRLTAAWLQEQQVQLDLQIAEKLPTIQADSVLLTQLILNLIRNAGEAMVSVPAAQRIITIRTTCPEPTSIELCVEDRGCGFPPEMLQRFAHPFRTTKLDGLGLGLAICRSIAEIHHGKLTVHSRPEGGTSMRLVLPLQ